MELVMKAARFPLMAELKQSSAWAVIPRVYLGLQSLLAGGEPSPQARSRVNSSAWSQQEQTLGRRGSQVYLSSLLAHLLRWKERLGVHGVPLIIGPLPPKQGGEDDDGLWRISTILTAGLDRQLPVSWLLEMGSKGLLTFPIGPVLL